MPFAELECEPMKEEVKEGGTDGEGAGKQNHGQREHWSSQADFILSVIGFCVGLGNVWRFPYLCYKNGGGAFLIPYFLSLICAAAPAFFLELSLGQYMSQGGVGVWRICPVFQGIGISATIVCFTMNVYYIVILAWAIYYLVMSFQSRLPWSHCDNSWNSDSCRVSSCDNVSSVNGSKTVGNFTSVDPVVEFWERKILQLSSGIDEPGTLVWQLAVSLLLIWAVVYFCLWKGVKWTGKVVYVTALLPYLMLGILLVRGLTLDGSLDGVIVFLKPDFSKLLDPQVWIDGGTQICYSFALGINGMIALGSYNKFHNNVYRQWLVITMVNCGSSIFAGLVIFSVLGFMAKEQGVDVQDVASSGPGLAFIAYPKAVALMPLPQLWAVLFFLMIICVGLDSQFVGVESFLTVVKDLFPQIRKGYRRELVIALVVVFSYLIGLSMVTQGGMYVFQLFDYYGANAMLLIAWFQVMVLTWVYGIGRFYDNLEMMLGYRIGPYLKICWMALTPVFIASIFIANWVRFEGVTYNRTYIYPAWAQGFGMFLAVGPMVYIPGYAFYKLAFTPGTFWQRWRTVTTPVLPTERIPAHWPDAHKLRVVANRTIKNDVLFSCPTYDV